MHDIWDLPSPTMRTLQCVTDFCYSQNSQRSDFKWPIISFCPMCNQRLLFIGFPEISSTRNYLILSRNTISGTVMYFIVILHLGRTATPYCHSGLFRSFPLQTSQKCKTSKCQNRSFEALIFQLSLGVIGVFEWGMVRITTQSWSWSWSIEQL